MATKTRTQQPNNTAPSQDFDAALAGSIDKVVPGKKQPDTDLAAEEAALFQAEQAAEAVAAPPAKPDTEPKPPKKRQPSKTKGVLPTHGYPGPREGSFYLPKEGSTIPSRDVYARRYLSLISRPEGCDENTGRRVNTDRGPTVGGFASYAAKNTGQIVIFSEGAYRVGVLNAKGLVEVADDITRETVFQACGGEDYLKTVVDRLGPDVFAGLPAAPARKTKEKAAA